MDKMGNLLLDMESILDKMIDQHDIQFGDILNLVYGHLIIHRPDAREEYTAGGHPLFKYGPPPDRKRVKKDILNLLKTWENCKMEPKLAEDILKIIEKEYL